MNVYLSGPMTGLPEFNYPAFHAAAAELRASGLTVYNPAEYERDGRTFEPRAAFKEYTAFICDADAVHMLCGWESSRGARAEHALAVALGLRITYA